MNETVMNETDTLEALIEITKSFGEVYELSKTTTSLKDELQRRFFEAATQEMATKPLSQRVVEIPSGVDPHEWAATHYPGWRLDDESLKPRIRTSDLVGIDSGYKAIIREDPAFSRFSFINPEDGKVYSRTTQQGAASLDVERLKQNPRLMHKVTEWSPDLVELIVQFTKWNKINAYYNPEITVELFLDECGELLGIERIFKDPNGLDDQTLSELQEYMLPGKMIVKLVPPRDAKPEELE